MTSWTYPLLSVLIVSLVSFIGVFTLPFKEKKLHAFLIYFVSFAAGALMGDVFIHLLPEITEESGFTLAISLYILLGIIVSFIIEKFICWHHCHLPSNEQHIHRFAYMNLIGDSIHNLIDGLIIGASFLVSFPVGFASTVAVILHEIPQEIGDFGVFLHAGMSRSRALAYNFLTALTAILGVIITLLLQTYVQNINMFLVPFAAGSFIYIAGSDLIPELHKHVAIKQGLLQTITFIAGIGVMMLLLLLE